MSKPNKAKPKIKFYKFKMTLEHLFKCCDAYYKETGYPPKTVHLNPYDFNVLMESEQLKKPMYVRQALPIIFQDFAL